MSQCLYDINALALYDPDEHRATVRILRKRQDAADEEAEVITHQRAAELMCMKGDNYESAFARFNRLCNGERVPLMSLYEYWLHPEDVDVVAVNDATARAEWDALVEKATAQGLTFGDIAAQERHTATSHWKQVAISIRNLEIKMGGKSTREEITRAHLLSLAAEFRASQEAVAA